MSDIHSVMAEYVDNLPGLAGEIIRLRAEIERLTIERDAARAEQDRLIKKFKELITAGSCVTHSEMAFAVYLEEIKAAGCLLCQQERAEAAEAERDVLREALDYLVQVVDDSTYGEDGLHTLRCPYPDHGRCTCDAYAAMDMARKALTGRPLPEPPEGGQP